MLSACYVQQNMTRERRVKKKQKKKACACDTTFIKDLDTKRSKAWKNTYFVVEERRKKERKKKKKKNCNSKQVITGVTVRILTTSARDFFSARESAVSPCCHKYIKT